MLELPGLAIIRCLFMIPARLRFDTRQDLESAVRGFSAPMVQDVLCDSCVLFELVVAFQACGTVCKDLQDVCLPWTARRNMLQFRKP